MNTAIRMIDRLFRRSYQLVTRSRWTAITVVKMCTVIQINKIVFVACFQVQVTGIQTRHYRVRVIKKFLSLPS